MSCLMAVAGECRGLAQILQTICSFVGWVKQRAENGGSAFAKIIRGEYSLCLKIIPLGFVA